MGLCKCPERKITNIFCYEHRVNVCEHCLMHNHPKCVVDTYRNWITDSVYTSKCNLCEKELSEGETVRLMCLHILHWKCLDDWARTLPATTAPAGYMSPCCQKMCLFPAQNQISPIADVLRSKMGEVNWARAGLGLPPIQEDRRGSSLEHSALDDITKPGSFYRSANEVSGLPEATSNAGSQSTSAHYLRHPPEGIHYGVNSKVSPNVNYSIGSQQSTLVPSSGYLSQTNSRKLVKSDSEMPLFFDEDDHKYRRRPPLESLTRLIKNFSPFLRRRPWKRKSFGILLVLIVLLIFFLVSIGRRDYDDDAFNPKANPNVLIGDGPALKLDVS